LNQRTTTGFITWVKMAQLYISCQNHISGKCWVLRYREGRRRKDDSKTRFMSRKQIDFVLRGDSYHGTGGTSQVARTAGDAHASMAVSPHEISTTPMGREPRESAKLAPKRAHTAENEFRSSSRSHERLRWENTTQANNKYHYLAQSIWYTARRRRTGATRRSSSMVGKFAFANRLQFGWFPQLRSESLFVKSEGFNLNYKFCKQKISAPLPI
jgi:hypothetical protein